MRAHRFRFRVRTLLLLTAVVPMSGLAGLATVSAADKWGDHLVTAAILAEAERMNDLMEARTAVAAEGLAATVISRAGELGVDEDRLLELYDIDFRAEVDAARVLVDRSTALAADPMLADGTQAVRSLRADLDGGAVGTVDVIEAFAELGVAIEQRWIEAGKVLDAALARGAVPDAIDSRVDALDRIFDVFIAGGERVIVAEEIVTSGSGGELATLIAADSAVTAGVRAVQSDLGPRGYAAHRALSGHSETHRFDAAVDRLIVDVLAGRQSHLSRDQVAYGATFIGGARWYADLTDLVRAASMDLGDLAAKQAAADVQSFRLVLGGLALVVSISLVTVVALARAITRPLRRISAVVQAVHEGSFELPTVELAGPRELADTAAAINDMALTLGAVEARAVALVSDDASIEPGAPLPGRTGEALQLALDRLHELASHDGLTGLLNRNAAIDALERELARAARAGDRVMALFIDLDGLKWVNDTYGHAVGDRAIAMVGDVLRATTRDADVVARVGGDEFFVAGVSRGADCDIESLARRVRVAIEGTVLWVDDAAIPLRCSIGIAVEDAADTTVQSLLDHADAAMYEVKSERRLRAAAIPR